MKLSEITEAQIRKTDPEMDEYYDKANEEDRNQSQGPYVVQWNGQGLEWYGNGDPDEGEGRYKNKFAGEIVAINVPSYEEGKKIADKLDRDYQDNKFYDESVYNRMGEDHWITDYAGAEVVSMKDVEGWELDHARNNPRVKNYETR